MVEIRTINIEQIELNKGQLEGLPANPRKWKSEEMDRLVRSIQETPELFEARGILVYPHGGKYVVIGGNMRYCAARELKMTTVPCIVLSEAVSIDKLKEIVIKDNGSFGDWDYKLLLRDWDNLSLSDWGVPSWDAALAREQKESIEEDDFDEDEDVVEPRCQEGDIWLLGEHRLMCGDSCNIEQMGKLMKGELADLWLTDPPYNVDYEGGTKDKLKIMNDKMEGSAFRLFLFDAFAAAREYLKDGGAFYIWHADSEGYNFRGACQDNGLAVRQCIIWNKNSMVMGRQDYQWKHEPCLYGWKDGAAHYFVDDRTETTVIPDAEEINIDKMKKAEMQELLKKIFSSSNPTTVIDELKPSRSELHPTMKPVALFGRLIVNSSRRGERVLDTFGGSGTTLIAAEKLGRKACVMELGPHYCDVIIARWEKLTGLQAVKE